MHPSLPAIPVYAAPHGKFLAPSFFNKAVTERAIAARALSDRIQACVSRGDRMSTPSYVLEGFAFVFAEVLSVVLVSYLLPVPLDLAC